MQRTAASDVTAEEARPRASERTCVGCRKTDSPGELVRVVASADGRVAIDPKAARGGRGAWVHPKRSCIEAMVKRHAAERSLKVEVARDLDAKALVASLRDAMCRKVDSLLVVGARTRSLAVGAEAVADALERERIPLVVVATDAGSTSSALGEDCSDSGARVRRYGTKTQLGRVLGRGEVALIALTEPRIAAELATTIDRLAALED